MQGLLLEPDTSKVAAAFASPSVASAGRTPHRHGGLIICRNAALNRRRTATAAPAPITDRTLQHVARPVGAGRLRGIERRRTKSPKRTGEAGPVVFLARRARHPLAATSGVLQRKKECCTTSGVACCRGRSAQEPKASWDGGPKCRNPMCLKMSRPGSAPSFDRRKAAATEEPHFPVALSHVCGHTRQPARQMATAPRRAMSKRQTILGDDAGGPSAGPRRSAALRA